MNDQREQSEVDVSALDAVEPQPADELAPPQDVGEAPDTVPESEGLAPEPVAPAAAAEASSADEVSTAESPSTELPSGEPVADEAGVDQPPMESVATAAEALGEAADDESGDDEADDGQLDEAEADEDDGDDEEEVVVAPSGPVELNIEDAEEIKHDWYILKVQSNRERSIAAALQRKVAIEGLEAYFDEILVPTEKVTEFKGGKKKVVERKIWPGYIAVRMHVNDDTWFAIRETSGIGDFTGAGGKPTPMPSEEIKKIRPPEDEETEEAPKLDIKFRMGDKVKVMEGNFENFEGEVSGIDEAHGRVTVMLSIFGRPTPVELEYWQVEVV